MTRAFVAGLCVAAAGALALDSEALAASHKKPVSVITGSVSGGAGVIVKVKGSGATRTTGTGFFSLKGHKLAGGHTLTFVQKHVLYTTTVNVPAGATLILNNITLSAGNAVTQEEDVSVDGTLSDLNCSVSPNSLTITPPDGASPVLMVFDPTTTTIIDDNTGGVIGSCSELQANYLGSSASAEGIADPTTGTVTATQVEVNTDSSDPDNSEDAAFDGVVQSANCPTSIVVQRSDGTAVTVNLSSATTIDIEDFSGASPAQCTDIPANATVQVQGVPQADGSFNADKIEVDTLEFEADGTINSIDCAATPPSFSFTPDTGSPVTVTIQPTTTIEVADNDHATCTDLAATSAEVEGVLQSDGSVAARDIQQ